MDLGLRGVIFVELLTETNAEDRPVAGPSSYTFTVRAIPEPAGREVHLIDTGSVVPF